MNIYMSKRLPPLCLLVSFGRYGAGVITKFIGTQLCLCYTKDILF